ncbi:hypothetical protein DES53_113157 [Roseimicrobium gellanilyticum]|uniref:Uncharacterized protein n=1 Tax=Roseimicrobium gellanilyticum TaxID=748857 RepID=A0A366H6Z4_9BACT|nr:hypothetical protein [Roseimicrobium gellanilyticum]RBP37774.1 hypothetical protein DES53_113157 [Roseimicrobium gellanilyticum]
MRLFAPAFSLFVTVLTLASCAHPGGRRTVYVEGEGDRGGNARESAFSGYRNSLGSSRSSGYGSTSSIWTPAKSRRTSASSDDYSVSSTAHSKPRRSLFGHSPLKWNTSSKQKTATASTTPTRRYWFSKPKDESTSSRGYTGPQHSELVGLFSGASGGGTLRSSNYTAEPDGFGGYTTTSRNGSRIKWRPKLFGGYTGVGRSGQQYSIRPDYENRSLLKPASSQGQLFNSGLGYDSGSLLHKNRGSSSLGNYSTGYSTLGSSSSSFGYGTSGSTYKPYSSGSSSGYNSLLKSGTGSSFGSSSGYGYGKSSSGSSGYGSILK